ncbi:MAG: hypothetical protein WBN39_02825, partial [Flavobacteriaceae bacterium]
WYNYLDKVSPLVVERDNKGAIVVPKVLYYNYSKFSGGALLLITSNEALEPSKNLLKRSAEVFNMAYTRFLDLQKEEAQAREAQIEASLERIRASAMAMHHSNELSEVLTVLFDQFDVLGINPVFAHLSLIDLQNNTFTYRMTGKSGKRCLTKQVIDLNAREEWKSTVEAFKTAKPDSVSCLYFPKEAVPQIWALFDETFSSLPKGAKVYQKDFPDGIYNTQGFCKFGYIGFNHNRKATEEEKDIVVRFATEFGRLYQRYLDIEKAEGQAREAQIQLSLERIRARAMAMQSSEELHDVLCVLFQQFDMLGIRPISAFLSLFSAEERVLTYRATGTSGARTQGSQTVAIDSLEVWKALYDKWKTDTSEAVEVIYYPKEILPKLFALFEKTFSSMPANERMTPDHFPEGGYTMHGYTRFGYIGYNHTRLPTEEEKEILTKFATEFERVYQRFLDIEKAEAQAKEAQIEAALEKVRSASLAMHRSEDLHEVLVMLYNQLEALGLKMHSAQILESIDDFKEMHLWIVTNGVVYPEQVHAPFTKNIFFKRFREAVTNGESFYTLKSSKRQKDNLFHHFFDNTILRNAPQARKDLIFSSPGLGTSNAIGKYTSLVIMRYDGILYSEEENEIIKRFAKVLEQSYTRFLDIQKAEAQTREAQIEAALEKVRSRSLAMHTTGEMQQVANAVYDQLKELGVEMDAVGMSGAIEAKKDYDVWIGGSSFDKPLRIPFNDATQVQRDYNQAIESRSELFARTYSGEIKKEYTDHLLSHGSFPEDLKKRMLKSDAFSTSISFAKNSSIQIARYTGQPYSDKENEILKRFAKVFEQAYIRFMDIEKAEAQAREAQIEAALEKVRSRTMAMHKSQELHKVVLTVSQEIRNLGLKISAAHLYRFEEGDKGINMWIAGDGGIYPYEVYLPYIKHEFFDGVYEARTTDKNFFALSGTSKKEKNKLYRHLIKSTKIEISEDRQKFALDAKSWTYSVALGKHSGMALLRFTEEEKEEFSLEDNEILKRFSKVFEQAYIRFLDLAKAEKQAREAQIEAALERVRARSMAMHSSEELNDVLSVLFQQIEVLGIDAKCAHLTLMDLENNSFSFRITGKNGAANMGEQIIDLNAMPTWKETVANWKNAKPHSHLCLVYPPEILPDLWKLIDEPLKKRPAKERIRIKDFPNGLFDCEGHTKFGYIGFNNARPPTEEEISIVIRFAREFERVYQRFLDIKKAEAQTREAQIQLSLERVRARSMAMHSSEELNDVLSILFQQFDVLGIKPLNVWLSLYNLEENTFTYRATGTGGSRVQGQQVIDLGAMDIWQEQLEQWKSGNAEPVLVTFYPPEVLPQLMEVFKETFDAMPAEERMDPKLFPDGGYNVQGYTKFGYIGYNHLQAPTQEEKDILLKFATEFERVYQRFLDIEKAEAQTREAQIEAALEKVRSQSLSMHSTSEMQQVANAIYEQLNALGLGMDYIGMSGVIEAKKDYDVWVGGASMDKPLRISYNEDTKVQRDYNRMIKERPELFVKTYSGNIKKAYINRLLSTGDFPKVVRKKMESSKAFTTMIAPTKNSGIQIVRYTDKTFSEEEGELLKRFAKVFEQAYIRFRDLEKSEAQAREAQIEAALEKVRSRSLAMQKPEELQEVVTVVGEKLQELGVILDSGGVVI